MLPIRAIIVLQVSGLANLPAAVGAFSGVIASLADLKGLRQPNFRGSFRAKVTV